MQNKSAAQIQAELDFMRSMYASRRSLNRPRHEALIGWSLVTVALAVPAIAAAMFILL